MTRKIKTSITIDFDLLVWVSQMVKTKRFASRSHAIEYALQRLKEHEILEMQVMEKLENEKLVVPISKSKNYKN